jgi:hypothetical protein
MTQRFLRRHLVYVAALHLAACAAAKAEDATAPQQSGGTAGPGGAPAQSGAASTGGEQELESSFGAPVATGHTIWVANAQSGRVAYIDAASAEVNTVLAGDGPTTLAAIPDANDDVAIVLNTLSSDATLLREHSGAITANNIPVAPGHNAWAIASDGAWAIAWTDARQLPNAPATEGFQDLSIIATAHPERAATVLSVGYRPVAVAFASDDSRAFAVTQDGISIIALGDTPLATAEVAVSTDPLDDPGSRDVVITSVGSFALVRRDGSTIIGVVDLASGVLTNVDLGAAVTDLDLAEDGVHAIAVARDSGLVAILSPADAGSATPFTSITVTETTVGSVVATHDAALLYTNASEVDRLTILDLLAPALSYRIVRLYAPVLAVFPNLGATHAVVLHQPTSDGNAFSLVPLAATLPAKIVATEAPPTAVALSPNNDAAVVAVRDDNQTLSGVYVAKLPDLSVQFYALGSPPTAAGIVAGANQAFVAQLHPEGRVTLIDLTTGQARTLTGFELGARVVTGAAGVTP